MPATTEANFLRFTHEQIGSYPLRVALRRMVSQPEETRWPLHQRSLMAIIEVPAEAGQRLDAAQPVLNQQRLFKDSIVPARVQIRRVAPSAAEYSSSMQSMVLTEQAWHDIKSEIASQPAELHETPLWASRLLPGGEALRYFRIISDSGALVRVGEPKTSPEVATLAKGTVMKVTKAHVTTGRLEIHTLPAAGSTQLEVKGWITMFNQSGDLIAQAVDDQNNATSASASTSAATANSTQHSAAQTGSVRQNSAAAPAPAPAPAPARAPAPAPAPAPASASASSVAASIFARLAGVGAARSAEPARSQYQRAPETRSAPQPQPAAASNSRPAEAARAAQRPEPEPEEPEPPPTPHRVLLPVLTELPQTAEDSVAVVRFAALAKAQERERKLAADRKRKREEEANAAAAARQQPQQPAGQYKNLLQDAIRRARAAQGATTTLDGRKLPDGWTRLEDPASGRSYYCEIATGKSQWALPAGTAAAAPAAPAADAVLPVERRPLPSGWSAYTHNGQTYYYDCIARKKQWEHPLVAVIQQEARAAAVKGGAAAVACLAALMLPTPPPPPPTDIAGLGMLLEQRRKEVGAAKLLRHREADGAPPLVHVAPTACVAQQIGAKVRLREEKTSPEHPETPLLPVGSLVRVVEVRQLTGRMRVRFGPAFADEGWVSFTNNVGECLMRVLPAATKEQAADEHGAGYMGHGLVAVFTEADGGRWNSGAAPSAARTPQADDWAFAMRALSG